MADRKRSSRNCDECGVNHQCYRGSEAPETGAFCSKKCRSSHRMKTIGENCQQCGTRFIKRERDSKYCSVICSVAASRKRKQIRCNWCSCKFVSRSDRSAGACSSACRYKRMRVKRWVKDLQKRFRRSLNPLPVQHSRKTWEGWCHFSAMEVHEHKEQSIDQRWKTRLRSMVAINRHRVANSKTMRPFSERMKERAITIGVRSWKLGCKWKTAFSMCLKRIKAKQTETAWSRRLNGMATNGKKRMRRKTQLHRG